MELAAVISTNLGVSLDLLPRTNVLVQHLDNLGKIGTDKYKISNEAILACGRAAVIEALQVHMIQPYEIGEIYSKISNANNDGFSQ